MVYKTIVSVGIFVIALLYYYINVYDEVKSHYEVLGVSPKVSDEDIKKIYRLKSRDVHPDRDTGDVESFVRLREAYETLRDSREMYDRTYAAEAEERRVERVRLVKKIAVGGFIALAAISIFFSGKILTSWYMTQSPQIDPIKYRDRLELARRRQQERFDQSRKAKKNTAAKKKLR